MSDVQIADLGSLASPDDLDVLEIEDVSVPSSHKIPVGDLRTAILNHATSLALKTAGTARLTLNGLTSVDITLDVKLSGTAEYLYSTARSKVVRMVGTHFVRPGGGAGAYNHVAAGAVQATAANAFVWRDIDEFLVTGAVITRIKCVCKPGTAEGTLANKCHLTLFEITPDFTTPAANGIGAAVFDAADNGTTNIQVIDSGAIAVTVNRATKSYELNFEATNTVGTGTILYAVEITMNLPGPRNY